MLMLLTLGYLSPLIELYLKSFGLSTTAAGLFYSFYTAIYFFSSIMENHISRLTSQPKIIALGIFLTSIAFLFISQAIVPRNVFAVGFGLGLMGFAGAIMYSKAYLVPTPAHLLHMASNYYGIERNDSLVDGVSSLTNFFSNLGEILGPILGGFLSEIFGYTDGFLCMALFCLLYFFTYCFVSDIFQIFSDTEGLGVVELVNISSREDISLDKL